MTTPDVQAELDLRTDIKTNGVAIVERGSTRHYYKKLAHGWKHISTSTDASPSFDHEQTKEQREEALKQTAKVEEAMKKWFAAQEQPKATATAKPPLPFANHQLIHFCYDNEPRVRINHEVQVSIPRGKILGALGPQVIGEATRDSYLCIHIPLDIAQRDNWFSVTEFVLHMGTRIFHAGITEMSDDGQDLEVKADIFQGS